MALYQAARASRRRACEEARERDDERIHSLLIVGGC
jgi:hypothetical protein